MQIHEGPRRPQSRFRGRIELQTGCHGACTILLCAACNIGQCQPQKYACTPFQGANDRLTPRQPLCGAVLEEPRQPTDPTSHQTNPMVLSKHAATCEPSQSKHSPRCAKTETQTAAPPQVRQQPKHVANTSRYRFIIFDDDKVICFYFSFHVFMSSSDSRNGRRRNNKEKKRRK